VELLVRTFNTGVLRLLEKPWIGPWIGKGITTVSYVGRRSGGRFSLPVAYRRDGDKVTILVDLPGTKNWWRNLTGDGGRVILRLDGAERTGHAVAHRTGAAWARVVVTLDPPTAGDLPPSLEGWRPGGCPDRPPGSMMGGPDDAVQRGGGQAPGP
jgi:hypothetical protein